MGNEGCSQFITRCLCCSLSLSGRTPQTLPRLQRGSLPWDTVLHKLQCESFPWAAALHKLLQRGSLPWGAVLQAQAAPAWVTLGVTSPASKPASAWASLSMRPQVLAGACSSVGLSTGSQPPSGIRLLQRWVLPGLQGDSLPHHGLHRLQGNLCSGAWSTSSPSFFTDVGVCRVVSHTYSQFSVWLQLQLHSNFFPFLNLLSERH